MANESDRLLTSVEAAALLGVSVPTLFKLRDRGEIEFVQLFGSRKGVRYSLISLTNWIASRQQRNDGVAPRRGTRVRWNGSQEAQRQSDEAYRRLKPKTTATAGTSPHAETADDAADDGR